MMDKILVRCDQIRLIKLNTTPNRCCRINKESPTFVENEYDQQTSSY